ncbi:MAG: hypothetical protein ABMA64_16240 [Myxococcota bacterium]
MNLRSVFGLTWVLSSGCPSTPSPRPDRGDDDAPPQMLESWSFTDRTSSAGTWEVRVDVPPDVTHFQVTARADGYVSMERLYDPDGVRVLRWQDWYWSPYSLTSAVFGFSRTTAFDWPVRDSDGPLEPGEWRMVWSVVDDDGYYVPNAPVDGWVALKRDDDAGEAQVSVRIVYADGVDADPAVVDAVEQAVERWREIWAMYGLSLDERYESSALDPHLPWTFTADDPAVEAVAEDKDPRELQLIVGEQVRQSNSLYGVAASIPGTIQATTATYVVLSWLTHAGVNAAFDEDEIRLMGETMAHEVGHYQGLFHPVEGGYEYWDALDDTVECLGPAACEDALGTNLMYPYSICGGGSCLATDQLTPDQVGVLQGYVGSL